MEETCSKCGIGYHGHSLDGCGAFAYRKPEAPPAPKPVVLNADVIAVIEGDALARILNTSMAYSTFGCAMLWLPFPDAKLGDKFRVTIEKA